MCKTATLRELSEMLASLLQSYPDLADREVLVSSECGYSTSGISSPVELYTFVRRDNFVHLLTNDDRPDLNRNNRIISYGGK